MKNAFELKAIIPITELGPIMEHILTTKDATVLSCMIFKPVFAQPRDYEKLKRKLNPKAKPKKASRPKRPAGEARAKALEIIKEELDQVPVGDTFKIGAARSRYLATGMFKGAFWKSIQHMKDEGILERVELKQGTYRRVA